MLIIDTHIPGEEETTEWLYLRTEGTSRDWGEVSFIFQAGREMKPIRLDTGCNAAVLADGGRNWVNSLSHLERGIPGEGRETLG